ncbi:MAG: FAD-binding oxidoreductase [Candidatus Omnitrophica bacterium]|nr:FAD-binding oxidoreductase [Candidatus Omnitrophota bacterium]
MPEELELKVKEIIPRTHNVKSFRLEVKKDVAFKAGQYMIVSLKAGKEWTRPLSISSSPTEKGYIEFTKKLTGSDFSKRLNELRPGDKLSARYPFGKFTLEGAPPKIAFLSGGIGITPIRSICKYIVDEETGTDVALLYGNCSERDIVFKDDFDMMAKSYAKLKVVHVLSRPEEDPACRSGYITGEIISEDIPDFADRRFFVCGPPGMVDAMKKILLEELFVKREYIITEGFLGY